METYYAITRRNGSWEYLCSGPDPQEVYREAIDMIEIPGIAATDDDDGSLYTAPSSERLLDTLRVVPEDAAREKYHVVFSTTMGGD